MKAWLLVLFVGMLKIPLKVLALVWVPFLNDYHRVNHPVFGVSDATDLSWKNIAFRNGAHNATAKKTPAFTSHGDTDMEAEGFKKRYRKSVDGRYVSFRMTWGKPHQTKGKKEFYIGWTMNDKPYMRVTFFQFTPLRGLFG